jgi:hypothetical protein
MSNKYRKGGRLLACMATAWLVVGSTTPVLATSENGPRLEVQAGPSYMDTYGATAIFIEAMGQQSVIGHSSITWQPVASLGWIDQREIARFDESRYRASHQAELIAGGARWHLGAGQTWYQPLFFGFEVAYNHQATQALSSHYEFVSTLGWQGKRFSFQLRHISNGGLHDPNRGETMALAGVGFTL